jgi:hypothetical protein
VLVDLLFKKINLKHLILIRANKKSNIPDSNHALGQRWQMVGLVGRWLALAFQHWANVGPATVHQL